MDRLDKIVQKISQLGEQIRSDKSLIKKLEEENNDLKQQLDQLKKTNFELKKQFDIANMANQFHADSEDSAKMKRKIDRYIKEVDQVIEALKYLE